MAWAELLPGGKKYRGCWRTPDGKQDHTRRETHPEHPYGRKRDALEAAQEEEVKARRQASAKRGTIKASTPWGDWWDLIKPEHPDSDTAAVEKSIVKNYLRPHWGETPLNKIPQVEVKAWLADLLPGREPSYVRRIYAVFRWSMNQALDRGVLDASPCVGVTIPKPPKRAKPWTDEEFVAAIAPHLPADYYRDLVDLGLETGLRPGELCGLHADLCDLKAGWLTVSKVLVSRSRTIRHYPKDKDARSVPLTEKAIEIITRNLDGRDRSGGCGLPHTNGKACHSVLVFTNRARHVVTPQAWEAAMRRATGKAKIPAGGRSPYSVRRAFFTRAARGGLDAFELAEIGGHADVKQTQEYVQQSPAARERLRMALGETPRLTVVSGHAGAKLGQTSTNGPHTAPNTGREGTGG